ncbi:unnamed protein product, partial [Nesidiocoris tenuis]
MDGSLSLSKPPPDRNYLLGHCPTAVLLPFQNAYLSRKVNSRSRRWVSSQLTNAVPDVPCRPLVKDVTVQFLDVVTWVPVSGDRAKTGTTAGHLRKESDKCGAIVMSKSFCFFHKYQQNPLFHDESERFEILIEIQVLAIQHPPLEAEDRLERPNSIGYAPKVKYG